MIIGGLKIILSPIRGIDGLCKLTNKKHTDNIKKDIINVRITWVIMLSL
jgi:hypothetical protein